MPPASGPRPVAVELNAVLVALIGDEPQVLTLEDGALLPSGPFEGDHPTLQTGVRAWVERQTHHPLGYVEQLYTFADRYRESTMGYRIVSISYLGLTRERAAAGQHEPGWQSFYRYFPVGGLARGPAEDPGARRPAAAQGLGRSGVRQRQARAPPKGRRQLRRRRLERGAGAAALRAALRGGPGAGGRPAAQARRRSRAGRADALRPSPHPRHRHRAAARQDQIPAGRVRADAARLHPGPAPARRRSAGRPAACTSRTSAARSSSRAWSRRPAP